MTKQAITRARLEKRVQNILTDTPQTAGTFTRMLNDGGVDCRRHAVDRALKALVEAGVARKVEKDCERNGRTIHNAAHYCLPGEQPPQEVGDPFGPFEVVEEDQVMIGPILIPKKR